MRVSHFTSYLVAMVALLVISGLSVGTVYADIAKGQKNYKQKCATCHSLEKGKTGLGPSLYRVVGRKAGADANFKYSKGIKVAAEKGLVWDREALIAYKKNPRKFLRKFVGSKVSNKMTNKFKKLEFRENVVDYLESLQKKERACRMPTRRLGGSRAHGRLVACRFPTWV